MTAIDGLKVGPALNRVEGLLCKYEELVRLREQNLSAEQAKPRLRRLGHLFPGALRELDQFPLSELRARRDGLRRCAERGLMVPEDPWLRWTGQYHAWLRFALRVRAAHGPRAESGGLKGVRAARYGALGDEPEGFQCTDELVHGVLQPPGGRLSRWALERLRDQSGHPLAVLRRELAVGQRTGSGQDLASDPPPR